MNKFIVSCRHATIGLRAEKRQCVLLASVCGCREFGRKMIARNSHAYTATAERFGNFESDQDVDRVVGRSGENCERIWK